MEFTEEDKRNWLKMWGFIEGSPEAEQAWADKLALHNGVAAQHYVIGDISAYRSMATGQIVEGRSAHREHLRRHNLVEVGNDLDKATPKAAKPDHRLKETIARQVYEKLRYT
jgi:hypothetical protein